MSAIETFEKLVSLIEPADLEGLSDREVIEQWQAQYGLKPDGDLGPVTTRMVERPRFCGVRDRLNINGKICRWDRAKWDGKRFTTNPPQLCIVPYFVNGKAAKLTKQQTDSAVAEAVSAFMKVSAFVYVPVDSASAANLIISFGKIDGASSVLAWCELPCGPDSEATQLKSLVDDHEPWVISANPSNGYVDIVRVIRHELAHGAGMDHIADGNLLAPYYDANIREFQAGDIKELQLRYGPPVPVTPATPPPVPPANDKVRATVYIPGLGTYDGELTSTKV